MRIRQAAMMALGMTLVTTGCSSLHKNMAINELRCEYRINPLGVDTTEPRLSWTMTSDQRGQHQTACQIMVATNLDCLEAGTPDLWDSGKVESDRSVQVVYAGKELTSNMRCYWQVRVWDKDDKGSTWSKPALWTMGLLKQSDWTGQWIGLDEQAKESRATLSDSLKKAFWIWNPNDVTGVDAPPGQCFARRTFTLPDDRTVTQATLLASGDNTGNAFVNGRRALQISGFSSAYAAEVTQHLQPGLNCLAATVNNDGTDNNPAGILAALVITFDKGEPMLIVSDDTWQTSDKHMSDWQKPEFDSTTWAKAQKVTAYGQSPWGSPPSGDNEYVRLPARMLRKAFDVAPKIKQATAFICGAGYYELHINGNKIGNHVLDPGLTDYTKRVLYATYDVTDNLIEGDNAVGIMLGSSRYFAPRTTLPTKTITYGYPKALLEMVIEYDNGKIERVVTDSSWKLTTDGPIRANNDYDGEEYDARMEINGWAEAKFDDTKWRAAQLVDAPGGMLASQMAEPIRVTKALKPLGINEVKPGVFIYDMGQNMVGWARLTVKGPAGTAVKMRFAETIRDDGTLFVDNMRSCKVTDIYTLKGDGIETYEPRFTYHGFRYIELTNYPGTPDLSTLVGQVVHSDVEATGHFTCSNKVINDIYRNITWGIRGNLRSIPTDCPQRDERQGWLGDIANEANAESYDFNMASFFTKWLNDIEDAQGDKGSLCDVAPAYWPFYSDNVTWPSAYLIIPSWFEYHYDDTRIVQSHYDSMAKWMTYMAKFIENDIMPRDNYGDWCVPPESPELIHSKDPARKTSKPVLGTTYYYHNLRLMARYATMLGKAADAKQFSEQADAMCKAFNEKFYNADTATYDNGTQTSSVLPLAFGMVPAEHKQAVFDQLVDNILNKTDGHIATGLIGGQWLMRVLSDNGRPDIAWKLATNTTYPSWGYMVEKGATTIWELWNGDTANPAMNSHNHLMLVGDLGIWLYEYLGGIRVDIEQPGFKHFILKPVVVDGLTFVNTHYNSIHGRIESNWKIEDNTFVYNITVPVNTTATVYVPTNDVDRVCAHSDARFIRSDDGAAVYEVGSGRYEFKAPAGQSK